MEVRISENLHNLFISSCKNCDYSLSFLLNSIDPNTCPECMKLVREFTLLGKEVEIEINDNNINTIQRIFGNKENALIEQLLWISILLPEI